MAHIPGPDKAAQDIKRLGKDPFALLSDEHSEYLTQLYGEGKRTERRQWLLRESVKYLFLDNAAGEARIDQTIAKLGGRMKPMVDWIIGHWDEYYRPKTWIDTLSAEQQAQWSKAKKRYNKRIEDSNASLEKAKDIYKKVIAEQQQNQAAAREDLKKLLETWGVKDAPLLKVKTEEDYARELAAEMAAMGLGFAVLEGHGDEET